MLSLVQSYTVSPPHFEMFESEACNGIKGMLASSFLCLILLQLSPPLPSPSTPLLLSVLFPPRPQVEEKEEGERKRQVSCYLNKFHSKLSLGSMDQVNV